MKKILAILLCLVLEFSLSVTAFAAEKSPTGEEIPDGGGSSVSPETGDISAACLSVAALAALAVAAVAKKKISE